jgi:hypothetical protein
MAQRARMAGADKPKEIADNERQGGPINHFFTRRSAPL